MRSTLAASSPINENPQPISHAWTITKSTPYPTPPTFEHFIKQNKQLQLVEIRISSDDLMDTNECTNQFEDYNDDPESTNPFKDVDDDP